MAMVIEKGFSQSKEPPAKLPADDPRPGENAAERQALGGHRNEASHEEQPVPWPFPGCIGPELEEHAAEDQAVEQGDDRDIQSAQKDAVHQRKGDKEAPSAEDEPGLVRVPDRCDAAYHYITLFLIMREGEQERYPETETVQDHIEDEGQAKKGDPDMNNVHVMHPLVVRTSRNKISSLAELARSHSVKAKTYARVLTRDILSFPLRGQRFYEKLWFIRK